MARIYAKPIISGFDNTLILDAREALVIPFDFSGGYTSARLVAATSITSGDLNEIAMNGANYSLNVYDQTRNRIYFGFMDKDGFPGEDECTFVGAATSLRNPTSCVYPATAGIVRWGGLYSSDNLSLSFINPTGGQQDISANFSFEMSNGNNHSGVTNYCSIMGVGIDFHNVDSPQQYCRTYYFQGKNFSPMTGYNDLFIASFGGFGISPGGTSTFDYTFSGAARAVPKYAVIYNPFGNYKLRIHSVGIFKVS